MIKSRRQLAKSSAGFTLLEILIALAIFAVLAVITAVGLRAVMRTHEHLQKTDQRLTNVLTAVTVVRHDVSEMINRPVSDTSGAVLPALTITSKDAFEFTRSGYTNPNGMFLRSSLQRVAYALKGSALIRTTWPVLDRAPHTKSQHIKLLTGIKSFSISYVNDKSQEVDVWSNRSSQMPLPNAMIFHVTLKKMGSFKLIVPIRGRGHAEQ